MKTQLILTAIALAAVITVKAQDASEIADKSSKNIEFESSEMVSTLKIYDDKGNVRVRQVTAATKKFGQVTKTIMKFLAPADVKGTAILIYDHENKDDDMWLYLPSLRKTRRIVSNDKGKSFMGSEFSNADMSKPNHTDFDYKIAGNTRYSDKACWQIEATAKSDEMVAKYGYKKKIMTIDKSTFLPYKTDLYDVSGSLIKSMTMQDYRKQSTGKYFAFKMSMLNHINKRHSEIIIDTFQLGSKLTENDFSVNAMTN